MMIIIVKLSVASTLYSGKKKQIQVILDLYMFCYLIYMYANSVKLIFALTDYNLFAVRVQCQPEIN